MENWQIPLGWLGGIGGAIVTFLLGRLTMRRDRPRLAVRRHVTHFSWPFGRREDLKVSFKGHAYDRLSYCDLMIVNTGRTAVPAGAFHAVFEPDGELIEGRSISKPENVGCSIERDESLPDYKLVMSFAELAPGDYVRWGMLVSGDATFEYEYRGSPDVRVVESFLPTSLPQVSMVTTFGVLAALTWILVAVRFAGLAGAEWARALETARLPPLAQLVLALLWAAIAVAASYFFKVFRRMRREGESFEPLLAQSGGRLHKVPPARVQPMEDA